MRGDGTITRRGRLWWIAYHHKGVRYRESAGKTPEDARKLLRRRLREIAREEFLTREQRAATVADVIDRYLVALEARGAKALATIRIHARHARAQLGDIPAAELRTADIERFIAQRIADGRAKATVNRETDILRSALRLAHRREELVRVPYVPAFRLKNARQGFFDAEAFCRFVRLLPAPWADAARFAYLTGWRRSEVMTLRWSQVDREAGEVRLHDSKSGEGRVIPIAGDLGPLMARLWRRRAFGCEWVFHRNGRPYRRRSLPGCWHQATKTAGIPGRTFHDLRRTAVRNMVAAGVPERTAMAIAGLKTRAMFDRYNIVSNADRKAALERVSKGDSR